MAALSTDTYGKGPGHITAGQARDGDVVLAPDGRVCQLIGNGVWGVIVPVGSFGPLWKPDGELILLARHGQPHAAPPA